MRGCADGASSVYGTMGTCPRLIRCYRQLSEGSAAVDRAFRLVAGGITLAGLGLQYWLMTHYPSSKSLITAAIHFFSFFTIQTNALIAACLLLPAIVPGSRTGQLLGKPSVRIAVVAYGALTALVYFAVLRDIGHDDGLERRADQILHYVTPALFFIDWLALVPKGHVPFPFCTDLSDLSGALHRMDIFVRGAHRLVSLSLRQRGQTGVRTTRGELHRPCLHCTRHSVRISGVGSAACGRPSPAGLDFIYLDIGITFQHLLYMSARFAGLGMQFNIDKTRRFC